jgi:hypothetical protein
MQEWVKYLGWLAERSAEMEAGVIVLDTFSSLCPVFDENDASSMKEVFKPVKTLASGANVAVVLTHHMRKSGGPQGRSMRGSSALGGEADIIITLHREQEEADNYKRVVESNDRYGVAPDKMVVELDSGRSDFRVLGEKYGKSRISDRINQVLTHIPPDGLSISLKELEMILPYGMTTIRRTLDEAIVLGKAMVTGTGKKGDPYLYQKCSPKNTGSP